jgi:hypothetical protein
VAGAGGLYKTIDAKNYDQGALVGEVLTDLLALGGEVQAADIDPALLGRLLPQWGWTSGTLMGALKQLCAALDVVMRARDDGTIWIGTPNPQPRQSFDYTTIDIAPEAGQASLGLDEPGLDVDQILDGLTIRQVVYDWEPDLMRAIITYAPGPVGSLFGLFGVWLRRAGIDQLRAQPGRVDSQNGDLTAQVQPDNLSYAPFRRAAIRYGLPDTSCTITAGSRCTVYYEAGSPQFPALLNFGKSTASKIKLGVSAGTQPTIRGTSYRNAQATLDSAMRVNFIIASTQLAAAGNNPAFATAFPVAAAALVAAANALGQITGVAKNLGDFEAQAGTFLTSIFEAA